MRTLNGLQGSTLAFGIIVALLATIGGAGTASASCTTNTPGSNVYAAPGDNCSAAAGAYTPPSGDGFQSSDGGTITATGPVTITTASGVNAHAIYATGAGSLVDVTKGQTLTTSGIYPTVQVDGGGQVNLGTGTVSATGANALGLYATGAGSKITGTGVAITASSNVGAFASAGGLITLTGGSASTTGAANFAAGSVTGGTLSLTGTQLTASGAGAGGLFVNGGLTAKATGSNLTILVTGVANVAGGDYPVGVDNQTFQSYVGGGTVSLANSSITVTQAQGTGVFTDNGGSTTLTGGSVRVNGADAAGLAAFGSSSTEFTGTTVTATALGSNGVVVGSGATFVGSNLTITTHGAYDAANNSGAEAILNGDNLGLAGGTVTLSNSTLVTLGDQAPGITNRNGGAVSDTGSTVTTQGVRSDGVFGNSGSATTLGGTRVQTFGNAAKGLDVQDTGTTLTGSNLTISTSGTVDPTTGDHAEGVYNGANSAATAGSTGGGTVTLTNSAISTSGADANGVETSNGGLTTLNGGSVATTGTGSYAVGSEFGGVTKINGTTLSTTQNGSGGLGVNGAGSEIDATGVTITTLGAYDAASAQHSYGAYNGPNGPITSGGVLKLTNTTISTAGASMYGVITGVGGTTTISGGSISTSGTLAFGIVSANGGLTTIRSSLISATSIVTTGASANGIDVAHGGALQVSGAQITTNANGAQGLVVTGSGSTLTATGVSVATQGGVDTGTGYHANGVYNGPGGSDTSGGQLTLTNSTIATKGADVSGLFTGLGGTTAVTGGSLSTSGLSSYDVSAGSGGDITLTGTTLSATANGAGGLAVNGTGSSITATGVNITTRGAIDATTGDYALGAGVNVGGSITLQSSTITTFGSDAHGIATQSGAVNLSNVNIITNGLGALGLSVNGAAANVTGTGVTIATNGQQDPSTGLFAIGVNNGPGLAAYPSGGVVALTNSNISTAGDRASAVATGAGGSTTLNGGSASTTGVGAYGVQSTAGGSTTLNGVSVSTAGAEAHALYVSGLGSTATVEGTSTFKTSGAGAVGLYAIGGGVINVTGATTITTTGGALASAAISQAYGVVSDGAGSQINLKGPTTINAAGGAFYFADTANTGSTGSISLSGQLTLTSTGTSNAAITLSGAGASFNGTGGGTITSAGTAISFLSGAGQSATFDNYDISNASGDLIFVDPSTATVDFNSTTANAGTGTLLDAVGGSDVTLNANNSTLTGVITTDPSSTSTVVLGNGTVWNVSGSSNVSSLTLSNSTVAFTPPTTASVFKTLTAGSFAGTGSTVVMNAQLGGAGSLADRLILASTPTGSTQLVIRNAGGQGGATGPAGIPLISTSSGVIPTSAFALSAPVLINGYAYDLNGAGTNDETLVSKPATTTAQATSSLAAVAQSKQSQTVTQRQLGSILVGAQEQINCTSCSSGFASIGSFAIGAHGRWTINKDLSLLAGFSYDEYSAKGVQVTDGWMLAGGVRYDFTELGKSRPFVEAGGSVSPYQLATYTRSYQNGDTNSSAAGSSVDRSLAVYGRVGWVDRITPIDEAAVYTDLVRSWQTSTGYSEPLSSVNPYSASFAGGLDTLNIFKVGAQYTHLFLGKWELNGGIGWAHGFGASYSETADVNGFGALTAPAPASFSWGELMGRVGYRFSDRLVVDVFLLGTVGPQPVGEAIHGGAGVRYAF